jgi:hypothetical protein
MYGNGENMKKLFLISGFSILTGAVGHFVFYPIIERFNNRRWQRLARPGVGVLMNTAPFSFAIQTIIGSSAVTIMATMVYMYTFVWNGAGVVLGYIADDARRGKSGRWSK